MTKRPGRSLFTLLMMTVGIMLLTGSTIALEEIPSIVEASIEDANMADFSINFKPTLTSMVEDICADVEGVKTFEERLTVRSTAYTIHGWPESTDILLIGVDFPLKLNRVIIVNGRMPGDDEEAILVEADYGESVLGKSVLVTMLGENLTLKVVGSCRAVWMPRWYVSSIAYALIPIRTLQRLMKVGNVTNTILVRVVEGYDVDGVMDNLAERLKPYGVTSKTVEGYVIPMVEAEAYYNYLVKLISLIGTSIFAVSMALLYSSLSLMVTQEHREIGTLKAMGAAGRGITLTYILRGVILGFIGGLSGSLLGVLAASFLISGFASLSLTFEGVIYITRSLLEIIIENNRLIAFYMILEVILSMVMVIPPSVTASRIPAAQAVKIFPGFSAPFSVKRRLMHGGGPLFFRYALRGLSRRKGRELVVVLVIVISVTINSALTAASESQRNLVEEISDALNFDFFVCLSRYMNSTFLERRLQTVVDDVEFLEFAYYTQVRVEGYTLLAVGMKPNSPYFNYHITEGRWFTEDGNEGILNERIADTLGVGVGDKITLSNGERTIQVTVVGLRRDPVFNALIVPLFMMQRFEGREGKVNAIIVKAKEGVKLSSLIKEIRDNAPGYLWHIKKAGVLDIMTDILTRTFQSVAATMIIFTWVTSVMLIFSIVGHDLNEERIIIVTLRALGMSRKSCIMMVLTKVLILGLLAAALCVASTPILLGILGGFLSRTVVFYTPIELSAPI